MAKRKSSSQSHFPRKYFLLVQMFVFFLKIGLHDTFFSFYVYKSRTRHHFKFYTIIKVL